MCSIQLSSVVDSPVTVTTVWRKNGIMLTSSERRSVSDAILSSSSSYVSQVIFQPFELRNDDGAYYCEVAVDGAEDEFIIGTGLHSNNVSLIAAGMFI